MRKIKKFVFISLLCLFPISIFASCVTVNTKNNLIFDDIKLNGTSCDGTNYQKTISSEDSSRHAYQLGSLLSIKETDGGKHLFSGHLDRNGSITCDPGFPASCHYK